MRSRRDTTVPTGVLALITGLVVTVHLQMPTVSAVDVVVGGSCAGVQQGTKFTNLENCRTYIICNEGMFELWFCPSGFYNPLLDDCDLDYKCILDNAPETDDETTTLATTSVTEVVTEVEELPEPSTTTTTPELMTPPESTTTISSTTEASPTTPASSTSSSSTEAVTDVEVDSTSSTSPTTITTTEVPVDGYSCPLEDTEQPTYLIDKKDCEKYYLCYRSEPIEMHCLMGMYWNAETQMCDYPQNVKCYADMDGDANKLPKCTSAGRYSMPHPRKCENFIMCIDGEQSIQQCDVFHHWDLVTQKCVVKEQAICVLDVDNLEKKW